jgi:hypothetical protein
LALLFLARKGTAFYLLLVVSSNDFKLKIKLSQMYTLREPAVARRVTFKVLRTSPYHL